MTGARCLIRDDTARPLPQRKDQPGPPEGAGSPAGCKSFPTGHTRPMLVLPQIAHTAGMTRRLWSEMSLRSCGSARSDNRTNHHNVTEILNSSSEMPSIPTSHLGQQQRFRKDADSRPAQRGSLESLQLRRHGPDVGVLRSRDAAGISPRQFTAVDQPSRKKLGLNQTMVGAWRFELEALWRRPSRQLKSRAQRGISPSVPGFQHDS
jgi:hypothetical protein